MAEPAHASTCVCYDCLPGGTREHRVRPWPAKPSECAHPVDPPGYPHEPPVTRARTRLRIELLGGAVLEQCRLCGTILRLDPA